MARIPAGADLIENPISKAPGFMIGNVVVMAGVPAIMQVMLDNVAGKLTTGARMQSVTIDSGGLPEGVYAEALANVAKEHAGVVIGSYPSFSQKGFENRIVLRCKDDGLLAHAEKAVIEALAQLQAAKTSR